MPQKEPAAHVHEPPQADETYDDAALEMPKPPAAHAAAVCDDEPMGHQ